MRGKFITFEGGDGAGKSTQAALLAEYLRRQGLDVVVTREPGGTALGRELRKMLLQSGEVHPRSEVLLFAADRAQHVEETIMPALSAGKWVISDRFIDSSIVYQSMRSGILADDVRMINSWGTNGLTPDLTLLVETDKPERRIVDSGRDLDRIELMNQGKSASIGDSFSELADADPDRFVRINGSDSIERVSAEIQQIISSKWKLPGDILS